MDILQLGRKELIKLKPETVRRKISFNELLHILKTFDLFWSFDYNALKRGKKKLHAKLKSGLCSDGFVNMKEVIKKYPNIRLILANHLALMILDKVRKGMKMPTHIAGVPSAATELGEDVARILGVKLAKIVKGDDGRIRLDTQLADDETLLLIEDICSMATGISETITYAVKNKLVKIDAIIPVEIVILNRGPLKYFHAYGKKFEIIAAFEHRMNEWMPRNKSAARLKKHYPNAQPCPLCLANSKRVKPKISARNWKRITN